MAFIIVNTTTGELGAGNETAQSVFLNASHVIAMVDPEAWRQTVPWSGNFTKAQLERSYMMNIILYPLLLAACTIGNGLNLIVLACEKRKGTTNCYMTAVALADLCVLWMYFQLFVYNTSSTLKLPYKTPKTRALLVTMLPYTVWIQETFLHLCDCVLIVFSFERLLAITRPFRFKWLQSKTTARITITIIFFLSSLFTMGNFIKGWYQWQYTVQPTELPFWLKHWMETQNTAEMVVTFMKFFGLLIINLLVIAAIKRQQRSDIGKQRAAQTANSEQRYRNSNYLLLGSVGLYLFSAFPSLVYKILDIADTNHMYNFDPSARLFAFPFCMATANLNYSINFLMYLTVSQRYRVHFVRVFGRWFCPRWLKKNAHKYRDTSNGQNSWHKDSMKNPRTAAYQPGVNKLTTLGKSLQVDIRKPEEMRKTKTVDIPEKMDVGHFNNIERDGDLIATGNGTHL